MRLPFSRRDPSTFFKPDRGFRGVTGAAVEAAGSTGTDSLDLLIATLDVRKAAEVVARLGADPRAIQAAAKQVETVREPAPGLTEDAKRVIEAAAERALAARSDPDALDLLLGLALADCQGRRVLNAHGIDAEGLARSLA